jgi:hypothetical protein
VPVDHYVSSHKGRPYATRGSHTCDFCGGALFVDHAQSRPSFIEDGVVAQAYHTDNGIFAFKEFLTVLVSKVQNMRFSGAVHQNGVAVRVIRTVVGMARTMMLLRG